jgi:hypothetical protein
MFLIFAAIGSILLSVIKVSQNLFVQFVHCVYITLVDTLGAFLIWTSVGQNKYS